MLGWHTGRGPYLRLQAQDVCVGRLRHTASTMQASYLRHSAPMTSAYSSSVPKIHVSNAHTYDVNLTDAPHQGENKSRWCHRISSVLWLIICIILQITVFVMWVIARTKRPDRLVQPAYCMTDIPSGGMSQSVVVDWAGINQVCNRTDNGCPQQYIPSVMLFDTAYHPQTGVWFGSNNLFLWLYQTAFLSAVFAFWNVCPVALSRNQMYTEMEEKEQAPRKPGYKIIWSFIFHSLVSWAILLCFFLFDRFCGISASAFIICVVLYSAALGGIMWFFSLGQDVKPLAANIFKSKANKFSDSTGMHLLGAPARNYRDVFLNDNGGLEQKKQGVNFLHFEYSLTAGLFLIGTIQSFDQTADVYVYQQAFAGMVMCNVLGICLTNNIVHDGGPVGGWEYISHHTFVFLASCLLFCAGFVPVAHLCLVPVTKLESVPIVVQATTVLLLVFYCLFGFVGAIGLWLMPGFNVCDSTKALKWTAWFYSILNFMCKLSIFTTSLASVGMVTAVLE